MAERKEAGGFGGWIKHGFLLYKNNFLVVFVATLLAWALSSLIAGLLSGPMGAAALFTKSGFIARLATGYAAVGLSRIGFAILGGPLFAGLAMLMLGLIDRKEPKPNIGDLFKGFGYFLDAFLFVAAWGIIHIALIGVAPFILSPVLFLFVPIASAVAVGTFSLFGLFLIVDRKLSFQKAFVESIKMAWDRFWLYAAVVLVAGAISMAGVIACGVGVILTLPVYFCITAMVYRDTVKAAEQRKTATDR